MPAPKPSTVADWDTSVSNIITPSGGQIAAGFAFDDPLPSGWLNWYWNLVGQWTDYLRDFEIQVHTWTALQTLSAGISVTQSTTNANGVTSAGNGSGHGVSGSSAGTGDGVKGVAASGYGVEGIGSGGVRGAGLGGSNSFGVSGTGDGTGPGGTFSSTSGVGVAAAGNATKAALLLIPHADPASPGNGDLWVSTAAQGALRGQLNNGIVAGTPVLGSNLNSATGTWYYWMDLEGNTHLGGFVTRGVSGDNIVGNLPAAYRPTSGAAGGTSHVCSTNDASSGTIVGHACRVSIGAGGDITVYADGPASGLNVSLDGISFPTF